MRAKIKATGEIIEVIKLPLGGFQRKLHDRMQIQIFKESDLDFLPEKETAVLEGWVARDKNGIICLYNKHPERYNAPINEWGTEYPLQYYQIPDDSFPYVTWLTEPKKVRITLEAIEE